MAQGGFQEDVVSIIGEGAFNEVRAFNVLLESATSNVTQLAKGLNGVGVGKGFGSAVADQEKLAAAQKKAADAIAQQEVALNQLKVSQEALATALEKVRRAEEKLEGQTKRRQKAQQEIVDASSLKYQSDRLNDLRKGYERLTQAERENADVGGVVLARIQELDKALKAADATQGRFTRNVGNYKSATEGLAGAQTNFARSLGQISGEFTNLAYGARTFFSSLSNNIGPAFIEFKNLVAAMRAAKEEGIANAAAQGQQAAAAATAGGASEEAANQIGELAKQQALAALEGQKGVGVFAALKGALFSFNTLIGVAVAALTILGPKIYDSIVEAFGDAKDAFNAGEKSLQLFNTALESTEYKQAIQDISSLTQNIKLARQGLIEKTDVVELYNKSIGEAAGEVKTLDQVEAGLIKHKDAYLQMMLYKAAAASAYKEAADKAVESQKSLSQVGTGSPTLLDQFLGGGFAGTLQRDKRLQQSADNAQKQSDQLLNIANGFQKKMADLGYENGLDVIPDKNAKKKKERKPADYTNEQLKADEDLTRAIFQELKTRAGIEADIQKEIAENEKNTLGDRLEAYRKYFNEQLRIANYEYTTEVMVTQGKLNEIAEIEKIAESKRTKEQATLLLSKGVYQQRLINSELIYTRKVEAQMRERAANEEKQRAAANKKELEDLEKQQKAKDELTEGIGSRQAYARSRQARRANRRGQYNRSANLEPSESRFVYDEANRYLQWASSEVQPYAEMAQQISSILTNLTNQRNAEIDKEIEKIRERAAVEIESVRSGAAFATLTEQEKARKIAEINATAAQKEKELERDKITRQRRAAIFEKAVTITQITVTTALAVARAFKDYIFPASAIIGGVVAALGAAQIAAAVAAPIPQYAKGGKHKGGLAEVGDGGQHEIFKSDSGQLYLTPAKSTLVDLPAGTIYPSIQDYINTAQGLTMQGAGVMRPYDERNTISTKKMEGLLKRVANGVEYLGDKNTIIKNVIDWKSDPYTRAKR